MTNLRCVACVVAIFLASAQQMSRSYSLQSAEGLRLLNVAAVPDTLDGKSGLRIATSPAAAQSLATPGGSPIEQMALIDGLTFGNGTIEAEVAGVPDTTVFKDARGFVGIAFRVQPDMKTYDAFYLRPTNGRADDQLRRNHSAQYISHPAWTWSRLRTETPGQYESYVDLVPNTWTKLRIEVHGTLGRLYVHDQAQPVLIVSDLKTGPTTKGGVALWIDVGTQAHFRNLVVTPPNDQRR